MELGYKFAHNIPKSKTISPKPAIFSGARCPCPRTRNNLEAIEPELLRCRLHAQPELSEPVHLHLSSSPQLELGTTNPSSFPSSPFLLLAEPTLLNPPLLGITTPVIDSLPSPSDFRTKEFDMDATINYTLLYQYGEKIAGLFRRQRAKEVNR
ncbi:hypothetical protein LXL04_018150 [Taraxacum kok-saghyz]